MDKAPDHLDLADQRMNDVEDVLLLIDNVLCDAAEPLGVTMRDAAATTLRLARMRLSEARQCLATAKATGSR